MQAIVNFYKGSGLTIADETVRLVSGSLMPDELASFDIALPLDTTLSDCDVDFAGELGSPILTLDTSISPPLPAPATGPAQPAYDPTRLGDFVEDGKRIFLFSGDVETIPFKLTAGEWRLEWTFLREWNPGTRIALVNPDTNEALLSMSDVWQDAAFDLTFAGPVSLILYVDVEVQSPWRVTFGER